MRKDVKRSLLLWPAAASLTITAVSWLPTQFEGERVAAPQFLTALATRAGVELLVPEAGSMTEPIEITARSEHGNRAMRMPPRVAEAFGVASSVIKAPVRDERQELAGLVLQLPPQVAPTYPQLAAKILRGDVTAADQLAGQQQIADQPGDATLAQSLRHRSHRPQDANQRSNSSLPQLPQSQIRTQGVTRNQPTIQPWSHDLASLAPAISAPATTAPESLLPRSNRALGRREFDTPANQDPHPRSLPARSLPARSLPANPSSEQEMAPWQESLTSDLETFQHSELGYSDSTPALDPSQQIFPIVVDQDSESFKQGSAATEARGLTGQLRGIDVANPAGWPVTTKLDEQLQILTALAIHSHPPGHDHLVSLPPLAEDSRSETASTQLIAKWSLDVTQRLEELRSLPRLGEDRAGVLIDELGSLAVGGQHQAEQIENRAQQIQWLRACHAVTRRVAVWQLVWEVTRGGNTTMVGEASQQSHGIAQELMDRVRYDLDATGDAEGWTRYLLLNEIDLAADDGGSEDRRILAQRLLSRLQWHRLQPEQQRWLQRESVDSLTQLVKPWAQDAVDYANLMHQIEMQETDSLDMAAIDVAGAVQTLRYADNPLANQVARAIDSHYRNANLRIAISEDLLQRALPVIEARAVPVTATILGSRVRGNSRVETSLGVELTPSPDRWSLRLNSNGNVATRSTGVKNSVAVRTAGQSQFESNTEIEITPHGVQVGGTRVDVHGNTRLREINTDYDGWPLVGPLVRSIAESRYQAMAPQATQIANQKMKRSIETEVETMVDERLDQATVKLSQLVMGPLSKLQLDPKVTDMQTTDERLLARFRVAGDWQMAAFTPRPRAPSTSLMSVQVHQSAINNTLEQLIPHGESMSMRDLFQRIGETFGQVNLEMPDDIPDDVTIQFSRTRPITVEIDEDLVWITLRIVRLRRADSVDLTQFIVRAAYRPQVAGIHAGLVREGHLRISGPRMSMRERLPSRTIFNKVFSTSREIPITVRAVHEHPAMKGLAISQLELRSGWLALAISEEDAPKVALAP